MARLLAAGITLAVAGTVAGDTGGDALERLRWSARVLLVLTPRLDDPRAIALREALARRACQARERDLVLMQIPAAGPASLESEPLPSQEATQIRDRFRHGDSPFQVLLLGKDGGVKQRENHVPDLDAMFALIDAMPMRRSEMRGRASACPG